MRNISIILLFVILVACGTKPKPQNELIIIPTNKSGSFFVDDEWTQICEQAVTKDGSTAIDFDIQSDSLQLNSKKIPLLKRIKFYSKTHETILSLNIYPIDDKNAILNENPVQLSCFKPSLSSSKYFYMADTCSSICFRKNAEYSYQDLIGKIKDIVK